MQQQRWRNLGFVIMVLFLAEMVLKIVAYGPRRFWRSGYRRLDVLCNLASLAAFVGNGLCGKGKEVGLAWHLERFSDALGGSRVCRGNQIGLFERTLPPTDRVALLHSVNRGFLFVLDRTRRPTGDPQLGLLDVRSCVPPAAHRETAVLYRACAKARVDSVHRVRDAGSVTNAMRKQHTHSMETAHASLSTRVCHLESAFFVFMGTWSRSRQNPLQNQPKITSSDRAVGLCRKRTVPIDPG